MQTAETIYGFGGNDYIDAKEGDDTLVGGAGGDRYSIGLHQGYDIIDDQGGTGADTLVLYTGNLAATINDNWFIRDGSDLLVRVPNSNGSGLAVDIRIRNMGSTSGQIEYVEIWAGAGDHLTGGPWNLTTIWQQKTAEPTPPPPDPNHPGSSPPPTAPPSGQFTWIGTSGANAFTGTGAVDVLAGLGGVDVLRGEGGDDKVMGNSGSDVLDGGSGGDLLIDDDRGDFWSDELTGGAGNDTLVFYGAPSGTTDSGDGGTGRDTAYVDLSDRTREWQLTDDNGDIHISLRSGTTAGDIELKNFEIVAVFFGNDDDFAHVQNEQAYLEGRDGDDQLSSEDGDDYLDGGAGDDHLDSGTGVDWIDGGAGNDLADVDLRSQTRNLTYVADYADSSNGFTFENGTHIRNVERINLETGSGDDRIWLGDDVDTIDTNGGDDYVYTELWGKDSVDGGSGYDRLVVDFSHTSERLRSSFDSSENDFEIYTGTQFASATRRVHAMHFEEVNLLGGGGNDVLRGGIGDDDLVGNDGDDSLNGNDGNDRLNGGAGNDDLDLDRGIDWADGGSGDDFGSLDKSDSNLNFQFDAFRAASSAGLTLADGSFVRNIERWDLWLGGGNDTVITDIRTSRFFDLGGGDNTLVVDHRGQATSLIGIVGSEFVAEYLVSVGTDFDSATDNLRAWRAGHVSIYGGIANDRIAGLAGNDSIDGGAGADILSGGSGSDLLIGGAGADTLDGGDGADIFFYSAVSDSTAASMDRIRAFQSGLDKIDLSALAYGLVSWVQQTDASDNSLYNLVTFASSSGSMTIRVDGALTVSDFILAPTPGQQVIGTSGNDILSGSSGDDIINGLSGADRMAGLGGNDFYYVDNAADQIMEDAGQGNDRVFASASYTLAPGASVEMLTTDFNTGTTPINLTGNELASTIVGNDGANILDGGAGADVLVGRLGDDWYYVDNGGDQVSESAGQGNDRVFASVSYALTAGASVEMLTTDFNTGMAAINLTGNELVNMIVGNDGANILDGGAGADILVGRLGDDFYFVDNAGDQIFESAGQGNDRVFAGASYALGSGVSVEMLTTDFSAGTAAINLTGNEFANTIVGNDGANILDGGAGADILVGRLGDDFYYVDNAADQIFESAGQGNDRVFASASYTLGAGVSVETVSTDFNTGTAALNLTGNELANTIYGNDGANILDGGSGADLLVGRLGDDWFYVDNAGDQIVESAGQGNDRIFAGASYALGAGVSVELLSTDFNAGTSTISLTGNELANTVYGNDGANTLDGGAGADVLVGRGGTDNFAFTTALGANNVDLIVDFSSVDDTIRLDDAVFAGIGAVGALAAGAFVVGTAAADASDRIIYNQATGQLYFDADGTGSGAAILFATLQGTPSVTAADFVVI
jgi:Ca2+-binding RTX toxin-like protein